MCATDAQALRSCASTAAHKPQSWVAHMSCEAVAVATVRAVEAMQGSAHALDLSVDIGNSKKACWSRN